MVAGYPELASSFPEGALTVKLTCKRLPLTVRRWVVAKYEGTFVFSVAAKEIGVFVTGPPNSGVAGRVGRVRGREGPPPPAIGTTRPPRELRNKLHAKSTYSFFT